MIVRFEGHIASYLGDGVLAYFGWPHAHEDDAGARADRAMHAGLALVEEIGRLEPHAALRLQARVGIATDLVRPLARISQTRKRDGGFERGCRGAGGG